MPVVIAQRFSAWREDLAPVNEVARWAAVSLGVALVLLTAVGVLASALHGNATAGMNSNLLDTHQGLGNMLYVLRRNTLVLCIHLGACTVGAIVGRPYEPAPQSWGRLGRLHRPLPAWIGRGALLYAAVVTCVSVTVQTLSLGTGLADEAAAIGLGSWHLLSLLLVHAVIELIAMFLPLGLFLLEARRGRLDRLGAWVVQAATIAVPMLICAALIETFVAPGWVVAARDHQMVLNAQRLHAASLLHHALPAAARRLAR